MGLGIIPAALHNDARTAFVIGLGCGQTAGWLGRVPTLERVDVVELEPFMVTFAERCALANLDALQNPKVRLTIGDGREALVVSDGKYDLIVSEPSNPYRAGIASLYSVDFYREAERHLAEGGLFAQWLQAYEVHPNTLSTVVSTMRAVFPEVSLFGLTEGDLLLVGSRAPLTLQADLLRQRLQQVPFTHALARVFRVSGLEGLLSLHLANPAFARRLDRGEAEWNSDDNPRLEFQFARAVGRGDLAIGQEAMVLAARARGEHRPAIVGAVDWERVQAQQERRFGRTGAPVPAAWRPQNPQQAAFLGHFETRDVQKAAALLTELPAPREDDLFDRLRRAEVRIRAGLSEDPPDDEETELLALESAGVAADVAWLRVMAARKQQPPSREVVPLAVRAIRLTREDPWVDSRRIRQAVAYLKQGLTIEEQHQLADALLVAPFGSHLLDESRWRWAREWSTAGLPDRVSPHCAAAFERNVPWERSALLQRALCFELSHLGPEKLLSAQNALDQFLAYESGGGPMDGNSGGSEPDGN